MPLFLKSIAPEIGIFGDIQTLNFNESGQSNIATLNLGNLFVPNTPSNSYTKLEFTNKSLKGFRFIHEFPDVNSIGNFALESFDRFGASEQIFKYEKTTDTLVFHKPVVGLQITAAPFNPDDASNKSYIDNHTWTSSQITDFDFRVRTNRLDQFLQPTSFINMNSQLIRNLASPLELTDAATKGFVESKLTSLSNDQNLFLNGSGAFSNPVLETNNRIANVVDQIYADMDYRYNSLAAKTNWYYDAGQYIGSNKALLIGSYFYNGEVYTAYLGTGGGGIGWASGTYSLYCTDRVRANEFHATSSIKKKNIQAGGVEIEQEAIDIFRQIPLYKYTYKDQFKDGVAVCYGVVSEQLAQVLPDYVNQTDQEFVPNILQDCLVKKLKNNQYNLIFKETLGLIDGTRIMLLLEEKSIEVNLVSKQNKSLLVSSKEELPSKLFAYGSYEICPSVAKQKLFELSMVVVQNLLKRIELLETKGAIE